MIAQRLGGAGEVVRVHADAVAAHQSGTEAQSVPLGVHAGKHLVGVDVHAVANHGDLVHKGDVDIPLAVLDHLDRLGGLDGGNGEGPCLDDDIVDLFDLPGALLVHAGDDLLDIGQGMNTVAGVDALRTVADFPILAAFQAGFPLDNGDADILRHAGVNRGLKDHDAAGGQVLSHGAGSPLDGPQIRRGVRVHRRGHGDDQELRFLQAGGVRCKFHRGILDGLAHLVGGVDAVGVFVHTLLVDVKANDRNVLGKLHRKGHTHIAEAHQSQLFLPGDQSLINRVKLHICYSFVLFFLTGRSFPSVWLATEAFKFCINLAWSMAKLPVTV